MLVTPHPDIVLYAQTRASIRVMSLNIRYDTPEDGQNAWDIRKAGLARHVMKQSPSIIGFQEVLAHQKAYFEQELLRLNGHFKSAGVARGDGKTKGEFSPIFYDSTRFTLLAERTLWLSPTPDTVSKGWDAALERICTIIALRDTQYQQIYPTNVLYVLNTHFDHAGVRAREESARLIVREIVTIINNNPHASIVLMGDFNAEETTPPISILRSALNYVADDSLFQRDTRVGTFHGFACTQHDVAMKKFPRIDHIFTKNVKVTSYRHAIETGEHGRCLSDHFAVLADIE